MFRTVDAYFEPIDIFQKIGERKSELSDQDLGFICGLIKEKRPEKIVELGVSAGGTSCVIMNCLEKLGIDSKVFSVDVSYTYHYDTSKRCGFQIDDAAKYLHHMENHVLMLGKSIAQVIEKIGHNIDMLILDTIHYLPGELLDFLICLPYLSKDAVIILDDLIFAHTGENTNAIATKVLFDLLVGEKVFPSGDGACPKMGGVLLNEDTRKYRSNYFSGLLMPWWYPLGPDDMETYRGVLERHYEKGEMEFFDEAVRINTETLQKKENVKTKLQNLLQICEGEKEVVVYGVGQRGLALGRFLRERTGKAVSHVISDNRNKEDFTESNAVIYHLSEIAEQKDKYQILVAAAGSEIRENLMKQNIGYIDVPNYVFPFIKEYERLLH